MDRAADLLAQATAQSGLRDLGDDAESVLEGLHELVAASDADPGIDEAGRAEQDLQIVGHLTNRLAVVADRKRNAGISGERIERPIIVCGAGRSGTTLLQDLLAVDPANRTPRWWEVSLPSPPPGRAPPDDPRRAVADTIVRAFVDARPGILRAHPYLDEGGQASAECELILQMTMTSPYFSYFRHLPSYADWYWRTDLSPSYRFHRQFLQHAQWNAPPRRWVLKGVHHGYNLDFVHATYPDAVLVWVHRDAVQLYASSLGLLAMFRAPADDEARRFMAEEFLDSTVTGFRRGVSSPHFEDPGVVDHIQFEALMADPGGTIRAIYGRHDLEYTDAFDAAIRSWLEDPAKRADRHGKFTYDLASFGIDAREVAQRLAFYSERIARL